MSEYTDPGILPMLLRQLAPNNPAPEYADERGILLQAADTIDALRKEAELLRERAYLAGGARDLANQRWEVAKADLARREACITELRGQLESAEAALREREGDAALAKALERAAATLPEGYIVSVQVENGAGWVELDDYGRNVPFEAADLTLAQEVSAAIDAAHEEAQARAALQTQPLEGESTPQGVP